MLSTMNTSCIPLQIPSHHKVKGTAVKQLNKFLDSRVSKGYFFRIAEESSLFEIKSPILLSSWYSAHEVINLELRAAELMGMSVQEFFFEYGKFTIEEDLNGIYRSFMRLGGAERILNAAPLIIQTYMNYMKCEVKVSKPGLNQTCIEVPEVINELSIATIQGACTGILNVCKRNFQHFKILEKNNKQLSGEQYSSHLLELTYY
jgi:hypothetical protein